ncbi:UNVERIFIED_CONTAM: hypothetical protein K2H54_005290 [Gekko kuhli]
MGDENPTRYPCPGFASCSAVFLAGSFSGGSLCSLLAWFQLVFQCLPLFRLQFPVYNNLYCQHSMTTCVWVLVLAHGPLAGDLRAAPEHGVIGSPRGAPSPLLSMIGSKISLLGSTTPSPRGGRPLAPGLGYQGGEGVVVGEEAGGAELLWMLRGEGGRKEGRR